METTAAIALASTVVSAGAAVYGGMQQSKAYALERQQYEQQAELARLSAAQEESARLRQLDEMLATQRAMAVARGYDPDTSGSFTALQEQDKKEALADIDTAKINRLSQARASEYGAAQAGANSSAALISGFGNAAGSIFRYASASAQTGGKAKS